MAILQLGTAWNAQADTTWTSGTSGLWQDTGNWSSGAPVAGGAVVVTNTGTKTLTIDNNTPAINLSTGQVTISALANTTNTLALTNTDSALTTSGFLLVQSNGTTNHSQGRLEIDGGNVDVRNGASGVAVIGYGGYGTGEISSGTLLTNQLWVGSGSAIGVLNITGGYVTSEKGDFKIAGYNNAAGTVAITGGTAKAAAVLIGINSGATAANGTMTVSQNGILETNQVVVNTLASSGTGSLSVQDGGVWQFTSTTATIAKSNLGSISVTGGVISYRGVTNVNIASITGNANITFSGNNAFRLNGSSNATSLASYTFDAGTPTNYQSLQLTGTNSTWTTTGATTIGAGGQLRVFGAAGATVNAAVQSNGSAEFSNSTLTFAKAAAFSGAVTNNASTVTFQNNATLGSSAVVSGTGGQYVFLGNLVVQALNNGSTDLHGTAFRFSTGTGGSHAVDLSGSGFLDEGGAALAGNNLALGTLKVDLNNQFVLNGSSGTNALSIGTLDLSAWDTSGGALAATLSGAFDLTSGVNVYYNLTLASNAYLGGQTYSLWGPDGGSLIAAVPEPSMDALMALGGLAFFAFRWRRAARRQAASLR